MDMTIFQNFTPGLILDDHCHKSAVCIPLVETEKGIEILFEVRSSRVGSQPGDICLPGGMMEAGETPAQGALRELSEELLLDPADVLLLGPSKVYHIPDLLVCPFVVKLKKMPESFNKDEVSEIFSVPLEYFIENSPRHCYTEWKPQLSEDFPYELINGGKNYPWRRQIQTQRFYLWKDRVIWGITAAMIEAFAGEYYERINEGHH